MPEQNWGSTTGLRARPDPVARLRICLAQPSYNVDAIRAMS